MPRSGNDCLQDFMLLCPDVIMTNSCVSRAHPQGAAWGRVCVKERLLEGTDISNSIFHSQAIDWIRMVVITYLHITAATTTSIAIQPSRSGDQVQLSWIKSCTSIFAGFYVFHASQESCFSGMIPVGWHYCNHYHHLAIKSWIPFPISTPRIVY